MSDVVDTKEAAVITGTPHLHPELDSRFPIPVLRPENRQIIMDNKMRGDGWQSLLRDSPAKNGSAEIILGRMATASLRAGAWVDLPAICVTGPDSQPDTLQLTEDRTLDFRDVGMGGFANGWEFSEDKRGWNELLHSQLAELVTDDSGRKWLAPTELGAQFILSRVGGF